MPARNVNCVLLFNQFRLCILAKPAVCALIIAVVPVAVFKIFILPVLSVNITELPSSDIKGELERAKALVLKLKLTISVPSVLLL